MTSHLPCVVRSLDTSTFSAVIFTLVLKASLTQPMHRFQTRERRHRHPRREGAIHADKRAAASLAGAANYQLPLLLSLRTSRGSAEVYAYAHGEGECDPKPLTRSTSCDLHGSFLQVLMKDVATPVPPAEVRGVIKKCLENAALVNYERLSEQARLEAEAKNKQGKSLNRAPL